MSAQTIAFRKMHGAGNDFILIDDRDGSFPLGERGWIATVCARRTGVGAEGLILVQPSEQADFRMRFFNPDGSEVEMCGNGARCVARFAHEAGIAPQTMTIDTVAGILRAKTMGDLVCLHMTEPTGWRLGETLTIEGREVEFGFVNSGVPHVVVQVDDLDGCDVRTLGAAIRYHEVFRPAGTNANFICPTGPSALKVRTYERGVEAETLACGTGIVASALLAARQGQVTPPVKITAAGGDVLEVDFELDAEGARAVTLTGPALNVFDGVLVHGTAT